MSAKKPLVSIIVAAAENNAIGKDNQLLWHLPNDLKFFKETTLGHSVIMGRKTFESVGRPLPKRRNIIISRQQDYQQAGAETVHSLAAAIESCQGENLVFIVGGAEIYREALPVTDKIYLTRVYANLEGDTFFPAIDESEWLLIETAQQEADEKHAYPYDFLVYERVKNK